MPLRLSLLPASERSTAPEAPPVVLVHGFATTATQCWVRTGWTRMLSSRDVLLVQLPCHEDPELTTAPDAVDAMAGPATVGAMAEALARILSGRLPWVHGVLPDRPPGQARVDLVGYSLGARLAWELSALRPGLVRRLVLGGLPGHDVVADLVDAVPRGLGDPVRLPGPGASATSSGSASGSPAVDRGLRPAERQVLDLMRSAQLPGSPLSGRPLDRFLAEVARCPFDPGHTVPECPVLFAHGVRDVLAADAGKLLPLLPDAEDLPLPGRTHVDALTSGPFRRAAREFLA